jgi:hypothetical protein
VVADSSAYVTLLTSEDNPLAYGAQHHQGALLEGE